MFVSLFQTALSLNVACGSVGVCVHDLSDLQPLFYKLVRANHAVQALPSGDRRQTLLFSATMTQALIKLQENALNDAYVYQVR